MFITLKTVHLLCLLGGGAAVLGNGILLRKAIAAGGPPPPMVAATMALLGRVGLASILLFWITGVAMIRTGYGDYTINWAFGGKLVAAAAVLVASVTMNVVAIRAARNSRAPDPGRMRMLGNVAGLAAVLAVILAVAAFQ